MKKLIRITTVPISLKILLQGQLGFMSRYFEVVAISSNGKELKEIELNEGVRTVALEMSREITPLKDLFSLLKMIILLKREKPDIVHTHTPKAGIIGMLAARIVGVPHRLHTVAGLPVMEVEGVKKKVLLAVEKLTYLCATHIYPNSYGLQSYILQNHLSPKSKVKVIGYGSSNGIDTKYFQKTQEILDKSQQICEEYKIENQFIFCFVGRVVSDKGINELLYAFDKLCEMYSNIKLLIVGKQEEELDPISNVSLEILAKNEHILSVGFQSDIRPYLACSDCFVLPTYREGFPNVVLQACAMEIPSIVTDINGCNEIIEHQKNGLIIKPKDKDALIGAMQKCLDDQSLTKKLSLNIRDDIIRKYDRDRFHKFLLDEYNRVLENDEDNI